MAPGGPTPRVSPLLQLPEPRQRENTCSSSTEGQKLRHPEPQRREAALLHNVNNQISQDGEPRTDSRWYDFIYTCGPRRLPGTGGGSNRPRDCAGGCSKSRCSQPHSSQSPEREETSRQDVSPSRKSPVKNEGAISFLPRPTHTGKWETSNPQNNLGALCHSHSHGRETCSWRGP